MRSKQERHLWDSLLMQRAWEARTLLQRAGTIEKAAGSPQAGRLPDGGRLHLVQVLCRGLFSVSPSQKVGLPETSRKPGCPTGQVPRMCRWLLQKESTPHQYQQALKDLLASSAQWATCINIYPGWEPEPLLNSKTEKDVVL